MVERTYPDYDERRPPNTMQYWPTRKAKRQAGSAAKAALKKIEGAMRRKAC